MQAEGSTFLIPLFVPDGYRSERSLTKTGIPDRDLRERKDRMTIKLKEGIQKQTAVVKALEHELDAMPDGLDIVNDAMPADKLTKELVDAFVEKVIMKPERQVEIVWKFKQ